MVASRVRSLLLAVVFCMIGMASLAGVSSQSPPSAAPGEGPATRPAPPTADLGAWHARLPKSAELPDRLAVPAELLAAIRRSFAASRAQRRERQAAVALEPATGRVRLMGERVGGYHRIRRAAGGQTEPLTAGWEAVGDFHTHPALADDPRHVQGFSPADLRAFLARAAESRLKVALLADGGRLWMIVRTEQTLAAWPAIQEFLDAPRLASFLSVAAARAKVLEVPAERRERWVSFHAGLLFNIRAARIRRILPIYFDATGRRHENVYLGGYALYVGALTDGVLERCDE